MLCRIERLISLQLFSFEMFLLLVILANRGNA